MSNAKRATWFASAGRLLRVFNKSQSDYELSDRPALVSERFELVLPEHEPSTDVPAICSRCARSNAAEWHPPAQLFRFLTRTPGGWLPRFDGCAIVASRSGTSRVQSAAHPGLVCEEHRRSGMKPVSSEARHLAEVFTPGRVAKLTPRWSRNPGPGNCASGAELDRGITPSESSQRATLGDAVSSVAHPFRGEAFQALARWCRGNENPQA